MNQNDISLKDFILLVMDYAKEVLRNWKLLIGMMVILIAFMSYKAINTPTTYNAEIKFLVEGNQSGGGLNNILGSLGIRKGGESNTNPYKIIEVALSNKLARDVLFQKSTCKSDFLANELIALYDLDVQWAESNQNFTDFKFLNSNDLNELERKAFVRLYKFVFGTNKNRDEALIKISRNDDSGIFKFMVKTEDECLTLNMLNKVYDTLKELFEVELYQDKERSLMVLGEKVDSIKYLIDQKGRAYAKFQDRSKGLVSKEEEYQGNKLLIEIEGLTQVYSQILTNYELADISLKDSRPTFVIIDRPYPPLNMTRGNLIANIIIALFLAIFLSTAFIVSRKLIRDILRTP